MIKTSSGIVEELTDGNGNPIKAVHIEGTRVYQRAVISGTATGNVSFAFQRYGRSFSFTLTPTSEVVNGNEVMTFSKVFDTYKLTSLNRAFYERETLTSIDVGDLNTSQVTNMFYMFLSCPNLVTIKGLSSLDVSQVTNMERLFGYCTSLVDTGTSGYPDTFYLANWNTTSLTNMMYMFLECSSLQGLYLRGWHTSHVTNMDRLFMNCTNLRSISLANWDFSAVEEANATYMFSYCPNLTNIVGPFSGIHFSIDFSSCPLNSTSITYILNGLATVTETKTLTFKTSSWNSVPASTKTSLMPTVLSKGWTIATR